jgi:2-keto-4-pentenoate hydratase/2-oxohepta-3-ene-1,7-dioic acid hydratase in catechol pathway
MKLEGPGIPLEDVKLLAPITRPSGAIICIGKNYADHVKEIDTWKTAPGIASPNIPKVSI